MNDSECVTQSDSIVATARRCRSASVSGSSAANDAGTVLRGLLTPAWSCRGSASVRRAVRQRVQELLQSNPDMLSPALHYSPSAKRRHEGKHSLPYYGDPVCALISPPRDHQDFSGFHHLPHAQPGFCACPGTGPRRKRISKIESAVLPECRLIERVPQPPLASVRSVALQRSPGMARRYLHCGGEPAGSPKAVVTAIFQPVSVLMKTRSDTPLVVTRFCVTR